MTTEPRIAVVGPGAIGGWIAARLALSGRSVSVLARGETLRSISDHGIHLAEGGRTQVASVFAASNAAALGVQDVVILAAKAPALPDLAREVAVLLGPETLLIPMLNGVPWWFLDGAPLQSVDPGGRIAATLPYEQILGCVVHAACSRSAPHRINVAHSDKLVLGEPRGGSSARTDAVARLFEGAGITVERSADVRRAIWYKLWGNATINPLAALTRSPANRLMADPDIRTFMLEAMAELAAIGAAIGLPIAESGEDRMAVTARLGAFKPSMLQDVEAGRPIELQALVGAPREIARLHGIASPSLDRIYALTRILAESSGLIPA